MQANEHGWPRWAVPLWAALALAAGLILWLSPAEQTLGQGIKWVYIHLAFIWTAMLGVLMVGILNLIQVFSARPGWQRWSRAGSWGALGLLVVAFITSVAVMQVDWGGITWSEPRMQALLRTIAIWVIAHFAGPWIPDRLLRGVLMAVVAAVALFPLRFGPLVMHPQDALGASASLAIRLSGFGIFAIVFAASATVIWIIHQRLQFRT
jgi:hypothetical protein